jgi:hypothetical protein
MVLAVAGQPVDSLEGFYRKLWSLGEGGVEIPLTVLKGGVGRPFGGQDPVGRPLHVPQAAPDVLVAHSEGASCCL